jgi:lipopolysaccharide heptosyltransferase I
MAVPRNILVIRLSSLGDVLLTMPAVRSLKTAFPESRISWLVEGGVGELLFHQGFVDRVIAFPRSGIEGALRKGSLALAGRQLVAFARTLRVEKYDVVLDFHGIVKSALLARTARADRRVGFDRTFAKEGSWLAYNEKVGARDKRLHKVVRNMLLASRVGARDDNHFDLAVPPDAAAYVDTFLAERGMGGPFFVVNPFCSRGSEFKRWDLVSYGELARRVADETGIPMLILWGPGEEREARLLEEHASGKALCACPTTVSQALALLRRSALYIGGDTGIMHLAALARVPVVAIFGPTDHLVNGPYGEGHIVVRKGVDCSPCRDKGCRKGDCLRSITVEEVLDAVLAAWTPGGRN